jgi:hypothetical protein
MRINANPLVNMLGFEEQLNSKCDGIIQGFRDFFGRANNLEEIIEVHRG